MKRFEFRLQAVLTLRQRAEQAALEVYGHAIRLREAATHRLCECDMALSEARRLWLNDLADGCPAIRAAQTLAYCHSLEEQRLAADQDLQKADGALAHASQQMLAARQHREAVENLMKRQRDQHDATCRVEDQKLIDDLVNRRSPVSFTGGLLQKPSWN